MIGRSPGAWTAMSGKSHASSTEVSQRLDVMQQRTGAQTGEIETQHLRQGAPAA
jgi:hypothetical protein